MIAKIDIKKGEVLSDKNLSTKRPFYEGAVHAKIFSLLRKSYCKKKLPKDEFILWEQL